MVNANHNQIANKIVIVTGGTQGVGEGIARHLAELGVAGLVICGRNQERGEMVASEITDSGTECIYVQADLAIEADCRNVVQKCDEHFGRVDGLVNAAAITDRGTIESTTVEEWDRMFAINTRAPFILIQDCVKIMKREGKGGSIVNILSMSSYGGQAFITAYCASKGALATLTKNVANALRYDHIRANGLNIGWTYTPNEHKVQLAEGKPENWLEDAESKLPFKRLLRPHDVAQMTAFLISDAAEMMTGALIDFDQHVHQNYEF